MLKKVALALGAIVLILLLVIASRPSEYRVERSVEIGAPPQVVFALVNDFHKWAGWSPWEALDPAMKKDYSGPETGVGAVYHWIGNDQVGEGRMTLTESQPGAKIGIKLEFIKPWTSQSDTAFTLSPAGDGTRITWSMAGRVGFVEKAFSLFMNMDQMIGKDFEKGLAAMKGLAETAARQRAER